MNFMQIHNDIKECAWDIRMDGQGRENEDKRNHACLDASVAMTQVHAQ